MAQHIPISAFKQKVFENIRKSIEKDFKNPYINGSLKYERLRSTLGESNYKDYQENPNDEIYLTNRYIGRGFIWGSNTGDFEIHFDKLHKGIIEIYLVA